MKKLALIFFTLFTATLSFAQQNYIEGKLLTSTDTIKGLIDYKEWSENPLKISFKKDQQAENESYYPSDIKGFLVANEYYESAQIELGKGPSDSSGLDTESKYWIETKYVFLHTVIKGPVSLYHYVNNGKNLFYVKKDSSFHLLRYSKSIKDNGDGRVMKENEYYKAQLRVLLNDCSTISSKIKYINYSKISLEKLLLNYYKCNNLTADFHKSTEKVKVEFGAVLGVAVNSVHFSGESFYNLEDLTFPQSTTLAKGMFLELIFPRNHQKWSVYNELLLTSNKTGSEFREYFNDEYYRDIRLTLNYTYLKLNNMLRYTHPIKNVKVFASLGISTGYAVGADNRATINKYFYGEEELIYRPALSPSTNFEHGYLLGLGAKFKKFSLECRYERGSGMAASSLVFDSFTQKGAVLLGYRF